MPACDSPCFEYDCPITSLFSAGLVSAFEQQPPIFFGTKGKEKKIQTFFFLLEKGEMGCIPEGKAKKGKMGGLKGAKKKTKKKKKLKRIC